MRTLYRASLVRTLSHPGEGEWILVDGRHVERVGTGEPPGSDRAVDLPGTTIVPGFVDAHVHLTGTGTHHRHPELSAVDDAPGLLELLTGIAAAGEGPLLVHGWDETRWSDPTLPTIDQLDRVTDRPLAAARADGHITIVNRIALDAAGLLRDEADGVDRDADGRPTGRVTREANIRLRVWFESHLDDREIEQLQLEAASLAVARGVTSVHEMSLPELRGTRDLQILLGHRRRLPVDVVPYVATTDVATVINLGLGTIGGDLWVDGSVGARTAWLAEPYEDGSGSGAGYRQDDELAAFFHEAHVAGLQVAVHAIGDAAIDQVISVWERVYTALDSRALRAGRRIADRARGRPRAGGLGSAILRRRVGRAGRPVRARARARARLADEPVPLAAEPRARAGGGFGYTRHDDRPAPRRRRLRAPPQPRRATDARTGHPGLHDRQRQARASGGEEGLARARFAR